MSRPRQIPSRIARAAILAGLLIAAAAPALSHARQPAHAHHQHATRGRATRGIDVSHYQGAIDWPAVARDHVGFAYIKATEGVGGRDARFTANWRDARRSGIRVGAYHYFIFCRSARAQAANFLAATPQSRTNRAGALPPAVDLEPPRACRPTGSEVRRELATWLALVEAREHQRAVLYVTPSFYRAYRRYLPERPMWRRSIAARPAPGASWALWQYRSRGRVAGIRTFVDLNVSGAGGGHASPL